VEFVQLVSYFIIHRLTQTKLINTLTSFLKTNGLRGLGSTTFMGDNEDLFMRTNYALLSVMNVFPINIVRAEIARLKKI